MTRKHFVKMAGIIGRIEDRATRAQVLADFIVMCSDENAAFDAIRFADAVAAEHAKHYG